jgi:quercetin dioxygenase-like cupin family protein
MAEARKSKVAAELRERLDRERLRRNETDRELAGQLGVNPTTFSRRVRDEYSTPDDPWIAAVADFVHMSDLELAELLVAAGMERCEAVRPAAQDRLRQGWRFICDRLAWPGSHLPEHRDPIDAIVKSIESCGIQVTPSLVNSIRNHLGGNSPLQVPFSELCSIFDLIVAGNPLQPSLGSFIDQLRSRLRIWSLPLATLDVPSTSPQPPMFHQGTHGVKARTVPVLPGILVHHITAPAGTEVPEHKHDGIEAVFPLRGSFIVTFQGGIRYSLDAQKPELLVYEANVAHQGKSDTESAVIVVHYSPRLAKKWPKVLAYYYRQSSEPEAKVST